MPTKSPRITFTPSPVVHRSLARIAEISKQPLSSVVSESLELLVEHLQNLLEILETASKLNEEARTVLIASAESSADALRPHYLEAQRVMAELTRKVDDLTMVDAGPPSSNTGVTCPSEPHLPLDLRAA